MPSRGKTDAIVHRVIEQFGNIPVNALHSDAV